MSTLTENERIETAARAAAALMTSPPMTPGMAADFAALMASPPMTPGMAYDFADALLAATAPFDFDRVAVAKVAERLHRILTAPSW